MGGKVPYNLSSLHMVEQFEVPVSDVLIPKRIRTSNAALIELNEQLKKDKYKKHIGIFNSTFPEENRHVYSIPDSELYSEEYKHRMVQLKRNLRKGTKLYTWNSHTINAQAYIQKFKEALAMIGSFGKFCT